MVLTVHENTDPVRIYHFVVSINNTTIADKIMKQVRDAPRILQDALKKALTLEASIQLTEHVHLGRPQVCRSQQIHHSQVIRTS